MGAVTNDKVVARSTIKRILPAKYPNKSKVPITRIIIHKRLINPELSLAKLAFGKRISVVGCSTLG